MSDTPQYTRRTRGYAHSRRLTALQAHFNTTVAIAHKTITQDDFGEEKTEFVADTSLGAINAYKEPQLAGAGENREDDQTIVVNRWLIYLQGYFPSIVSEDRAIVDGVPHNIVNVAHDDSKTLTMLATEIVNAASEDAIPL